MSETTINISGKTFNIPYKVDSRPSITSVCVIHRVHEDGNSGEVSYPVELHHTNVGKLVNNCRRICNSAGVICDFKNSLAASSLLFLVHLEWLPDELRVKSKHICTRIRIRRRRQLMHIRSQSNNRKYIHRPCIQTQILSIRPCYCY